MHDDFNNNDNQPEILSVGQIEIDASRFDKQPDPLDLPILPTRNLVLFPGITIPISLGRENSVVTATQASEQAIPIGVVCQINPDEENPTISTGLYKYGVVADVLKVFELPGGNQTAIVRARGRFRIMGRGIGATLPDSRLSAKIKLLPEEVPQKSKDFEVLVDTIAQTATEIAKTSIEGGNELAKAISQIKAPQDLINFIATNLPMDTRVRCELLSKSDLNERALMLLGELEENRQRAQINHEIMMRTRQNFDQNQRNAFLQQQMDTIREELYGDADDEVEDFEKRLAALKVSDKVRRSITKEIDKLRRLNPTSPDYSVQYSYVDTVLDLPWGVETKANTNFERAREILESDHYGLEKVKERIIEQLAVIMNNPTGKAPILCFAGAPGVGKTSVGRSVARALDRKYERVSLGGLHDESEIRGHRRTYLGSMPGRIIDAIKRAGTNNPVMLLDEIDKIGNDYKGDPAAALLEVLDPEQNCHFHDNYIDIDYDLSHVLFIATANTLSTIAPPLLDRMEIIELSGYILEEKVEIARRHLLPRILTEHNLKPEELVISDAALVKIIEDYTGESGVRQLEKRLAALARKAVVARMQNQPPMEMIQPEDLRQLLGLPTNFSDKYEGNEFAGVVTGLAWTQVGGEILLAEASLSPGKGNKLTVTGNLGDVMKESASIALQWVKANADVLGIPNELFEKYDLHIHFPEGAIPKDGPSAGITIATAIVSVFTQKRVKSRLAMTGEITLRGRVLPVGGIKEKILAAKRAGITEIVLSSKNKKDIDDIPERYLAGLEFHYVDTVLDVVKEAITDQPALNAKTL